MNEGLTILAINGFLLQRLGAIVSGFIAESVTAFYLPRQHWHEMEKGHP